MKKLNIREEIKYIVDENFDFDFDTIQVPLKRSEFIGTLTKEFYRLFKEYQFYLSDIDFEIEPNDK